MNPSEVSVQKRFWNRVKRDEHNKCWPWLGCIDREGYGLIKIDGKINRAHRLAYVINVGPIPEKHVIDHKCESKSCVNPDHLEAVTHKMNLVRYQNNRKFGVVERK